MNASGSAFAPVSLSRIVADIEAGSLSPEAAVAACEERIAAVDDKVRAFVRLAREETRQAAIATSGPLRGIALGVKDIFETADMATENGSPIHAGHRPRADAALVAIARANGAFLAGKTATTEFAFMQPAATLNPHDLASTPGGSSSGSAAAVAAGMVAGAFGSQTAGSTIRPAAFCGIAGFKPSFRLLPTIGMKAFAWSLDTAGLFAAGVRDVALLAELLTGRQLAVSPSAQGQSDLGSPRIGLYRSGVDDRLSQEMRDAVTRAARFLERTGASLVEMAEPEALSAARTAQMVIQDYEGAVALTHERMTARDALSPLLREALDRGAATSPAEYDQARRVARGGRRAATGLFDQVDALLVPSALGVAPASIAATGDPIMNRLWTVTGNPCINVPGCMSARGMPLGVTIVTRFGRDREALAIAAHLETLLSTRAET